MDQVLMDNYLNCSGADPPVIEIIGHDQHHTNPDNQRVAQLSHREPQPSTFPEL